MFELIGVPYTSAATPGGIATAIGVLRDAGLADALAGHGTIDAGDLDLVAGDGRRGPSGLVNEAAFGHLVATAKTSVLEVLARGRRPVVLGGDCPVLLGALAAGRARFGDAGLLFVDGHEDAWDPSHSRTGEASDSEIAIALGTVDHLPAPLDDGPLLEATALAMLGPRDRDELAQARVPTLAGSVALFADDAEVHALGPVPAAGRAIAAIGERAFWLHIDLDVLGTDAFPAADYRQPGGLTWDELLAITGTALTDPHCFGASVVIYNPDLDPDRASAARIVRFAADLVASEDGTGAPH